MALTFKGLEVFINPWINRDTVMKTDDNEIIIHPYTAACLMLGTTAHDYRSVFKELGTTDEAIQACIDTAIRITNLKIDTKH